MPKTKTITSEKRRVALYNIHPGENPRKDFGDIDALADAIRATGGDPINPIVVVQDGTYDGEPEYRLVDGERRWRALQKIHTTSHETDVIVFDSYADADAAIAMVATDDKKPLTEQEIAVGFQQMLQLNIDEERMAQALNRKRTDIHAAKKVAATTAVQATLDQLIAASEFEDEGDRQRVLAAEPSRLKFTVEQVRRAVEHRKELESVLANAEALGITVLDEDPDDEAWKYIGIASTGEDVDKLVEKASGNAGDLRLSPRYYGYGNTDGTPGYYAGWIPRPEETEVDIARVKAEAEEEERRTRMRDTKRAFSKALMREFAVYGREKHEALATLAGKARPEQEYGVDRETHKNLVDLEPEMAEHLWKLIKASPASDYETIIWINDLSYANPKEVRDAMEIAEGEGLVLTDDDKWFIEQVDAEPDTDEDDE